MPHTAGHAAHVLHLLFQREREMKRRAIEQKLQQTSSSSRSQSAAAQAPDAAKLTKAPTLEEIMFAPVETHNNKKVEAATDNISVATPSSAAAAPPSSSVRPLSQLPAAGGEAPARKTIRKRDTASALEEEQGSTQPLSAAVQEQQSVASPLDCPSCPAVVAPPLCTLPCLVYLLASNTQQVEEHRVSLDLYAPSDRLPSPSPSSSAALSSTLKSHVSAAFASTRVEVLRSHIAATLHQQHFHLFYGSEVVKEEMTLQEAFPSFLNKYLQTLSGGKWRPVGDSSPLSLPSPPPLFLVCVPLTSDQASCRCARCNELALQAAIRLLKLQRKKIFAAQQNARRKIEEEKQKQQHACQAEKAIDAAIPCCVGSNPCTVSCPEGQAHPSPCADEHQPEAGVEEEACFLSCCAETVSCCAEEVSCCAEVECTDASCAECTEQTATSSASSSCCASIAASPLCSPACCESLPSPPCPPCCPSDNDGEVCPPSGLCCPPSPQLCVLCEQQGMYIPPLLLPQPCRHRGKGGKFLSARQTERVCTIWSGEVREECEEEKSQPHKHQHQANLTCLEWMRQLNAPVEERCEECEAPPCCQEQSKGEEQAEMETSLSVATVPAPSAPAAQAAAALPEKEACEASLRPQGEAIAPPDTKELPSEAETSPGKQQEEAPPVPITAEGETQTLPPPPTTEASTQHEGCRVCEESRTEVAELRSEVAELRAAVKELTQAMHNPVKTHAAASPSACVPPPHKPLLPSPALSSPLVVPSTPASPSLQEWVGHQLTQVRRDITNQINQVKQNMSRQNTMAHKQGEEKQAKAMEEWRGRQEAWMKQQIQQQVQQQVQQLVQQQQQMMLASTLSALQPLLTTLAATSSAPSPVAPPAIGLAPPPPLLSPAPTVAPPQFAVRLLDRHQCSLPESVGEIDVGAAELSDAIPPVSTLLAQATQTAEQPALLAEVSQEETADTTFHLPACLEAEVGQPAASEKEDPLMTAAPATEMVLQAATRSPFQLRLVDAREGEAGSEAAKRSKAHLHCRSQSTHSLEVVEAHTPWQGSPLDGSLPAPSRTRCCGVIGQHLHSCHHHHHHEHSHTHLWKQQRVVEEQCPLEGHSHTLHQHTHAHSHSHSHAPAASSTHAHHHCAHHPHSHAHHSTAPV